MNNTMKVALAVAGAGAIAIGGTAFTATNSLGNDPVAGYGATGVISGVKVSNAAFTYSGVDAGIEMDQIEFTVGDMGTTDVTAKITPVGVVPADPVDCTATGATTIICGGEDLAALGWTVADLTGYGLSVTTDSIATPQ